MKEVNQCYYECFTSDYKRIRYEHVNSKRKQNFVLDTFCTPFVQSYLFLRILMFFCNLTITMIGLQTKTQV